MREALREGTRVIVRAEVTPVGTPRIGTSSRMGTSRIGTPVGGHPRHWDPLFGNSNLSKEKLGPVPIESITIRGGGGGGGGEDREEGGAVDLRGARARAEAAQPLPLGQVPSRLHQGRPRQAHQGVR